MRKVASHESLTLYKKLFKFVDRDAPARKQGLAPTVRQDLNTWHMGLLHLSRSKHAAKKSIINSEE